MGGTGQLALNQLLVTMDGIDNPPFWRRFWTNRLNNFLDATYVVPRRLGNMPLRSPAPRPANNQIYFIGATNVPLEALDPALQRPGRMGRHVWFRTPTKRDREDIFNLYLGRVQHDPELDTERARDELARITNGYSPAMVEQVCSMALTRAHHDGRRNFTRDDIIEAMTTVESGTAVGVEYVPEETRAVAIHEAGHAAAAHVFLKGAESTRISIRMRAGSLGHHQALEKEERFSSWKSEEMAKLAWTLGALAAEQVFYGENATGVGGDLQAATGRSAWMVGVSGMGPDAIPIDTTARRSVERREEDRERMAKRFESIGLQLMNRASGDFQHDSIAAVLGDPTKSRLAAQIIGQAYLNAYQLILQNKEGRREDRRPPRRPQGALRRRADRAAQLGRAEGADDRPEQGGNLADIVSEQPAPLARPKPEPSVSRHKFAVAYLVLAAIVGAAVGLVVVFATSDDGGTSTKAQAWSSGAPTTTGTLGVARDRPARVEPVSPRERRALHGGRRGPDADRVVGRARSRSRRSSFAPGKAGVRQERIDVAFPESGVFYQLVGTGPEPLHPRAGDAGARPARPARGARARPLHLPLPCPRRTTCSRSCPRRRACRSRARCSTGRSSSLAAAFGHELQMPLKDALPPGEAKITPSTLTSRPGKRDRSARPPGASSTGTSSRPPTRARCSILSPVTG